MEDRSGTNYGEAFKWMYTRNQDLAMDSRYRTIPSVEFLLNYQYEY